jgi:hypothetical protein
VTDTHPLALKRRWTYLFPFPLRIKSQSCFCACLIDSRVPSPSYPLAFGPTLILRIVHKIYNSSIRVTRHSQPTTTLKIVAISAEHRNQNSFAVGCKRKGLQGRPLGNGLRRQTMNMLLSSLVCVRFATIILPFTRTESQLFVYAATTASSSNLL